MKPMVERRQEEKANTANASWWTMLMCRSFGTQTYTIWTRPNLSYIKIWRGKSYYIEGGELDVGFVVASLFWAALFSLALTILSTLETVFGLLFSLTGLALLVVGVWVLWQVCIAPIKAEDRRKHFAQFEDADRDRMKRQACREQALHEQILHEQKSPMWEEYLQHRQLSTQPKQRPKI